MSNTFLWKRKKTGELVSALQWIPRENDNQIKELIISNIPQDGEPLNEEDVHGFAMMTMAIIDAHPRDWIIVEPDSTKALTPEAFERAYVKVENS